MGKTTINEKDKNKYLSRREAQKILSDLGIRIAESTFVHWLAIKPEMGGFQPGGTDCRYWIDKEIFMRWIDSLKENNNG